MPTYEYLCPKGHEFEVFQRISDEPGATCPECGEDAKRQISGGAGFLFKGDGFYITDNRSSDYKKRASSESSGSTPKTEGSTPETGGSTPEAGGSTPEAGGSTPEFPSKSSDG